MTSDLEQYEEIRSQILATQQYLRVICAMQLPFESVLAMERKALTQGRIILNQLGTLELHQPGGFVLQSAEGRAPSTLERPKAHAGQAPLVREPEPEPKPKPKPKPKSEPSVVPEMVAVLVEDDDLENMETPRPAPPRRKHKLVSKVRSRKTSAPAEESGGGVAENAIARAKAQVEAAKAKKRVTKVKLGIPSNLREQVKSTEAAKPKSEPKLKRASSKAVGRVKLGRSGRQSDAGQETGEESDVRKVSPKHRMRNIGGRSRDESRYRDTAASQIKAQRKGQTVEEEEEEDLTIAIGDAEDYDAEDVAIDGKGVFSLSVELAEGEEEEEEEEDDIPYLEPIGRGTAGSGRSGKPAVEEPLPPPRKVRERVAEHVLEKMFEEAHEHLVAGDLQMAVQQLSDIIDLEENFLLAYVARGRIFLDLGDYARAMSDFTIAHETGPDEAEPQLAIGDLYFSRKDYDRAIQFFNGALSVVPDNAMALCRRGISHYYERNFERAQNDLGRALELDGHIPNASTYLSMAKKKSSR